MKNFLVLGFTSSSRNAPAKEIYLGPDRAQAEAETNDPSGLFARKEFYELDTPNLKKRFEESVV